VNVDWGLVAILVAVLVPSVILHEVSHGAVALAFGDDTAKQQGRLTLNPLPHIDAFGTVLLPALLAVSGLGAFGYAKPVPVNVRRLRNPRQHSLYVSLVGPLVNIALALLAVVVFRLLFDAQRMADGTIVVPGMAARVVFFFGFINVILAAFNLLPIPPLDGSAMVERMLPHRWWPAWLQFRRYSFVVLLAVIFLLPGTIAPVFTFAIDVWMALL
jgi:Zn-dependent protease